MIFRQRYSFISKRGIIFLFCLLASISLVSAQGFIITQPVSQTVCNPQYATFSVTVVGGTNYTYQWYRKITNGWQIISGEGAKGIDFQTKDAGTYRCVVTELSNPPKQQISDTAKLTVQDKPIISGIVAPAVCNDSTLVAYVDRITVNGSDLQSFDWVLGGTSVGSGSIAAGSNVVPNLNYPVDNTHNKLVLTLTVTNGCGSTTSSTVPITVWDTPSLPVPNTEDYCQGATSKQLSIIGDNPAVWYTSATGNEVIPAPTPDTSTPGTKTWWVMQKVTTSGTTCDSRRTPATVTVFPTPTYPSFTSNYDLCAGDNGITLTATGTDVIQWYDFRKENQSSAAPQINASTPGPQIYYVNQISTYINQANKPLECGSPIDENAKITVNIKSRAVLDAMDLLYAPELCPNNSTVIEATSQVPNSTFRWYTNDDKTGLVYTGPTFTTPVLTHDTNYYVTLEYSGVCESASPKGVNIKVKDNTLPEITIPKTVVEVGTNDGVCYATNVDIGQPVVSDNCTDESNLIVYTVPPAPTVYPLGSTTLDWWVVDENGNNDHAPQTILVKDKEKPRGTCPADIIVEVNEDVDSTMVTYNLNYTDNCSPTVNYEMKSKNTASGSFFKLGTTHVKYEISDSVGNTETCEFNIIVRHPYRPMEVTLKASPYEICPSGEVTLTAMISGGSGTYVYSWKPRTWTDPVMKDYPLENTTYEVTVSDGITTQTKAVTIKVQEIQQVHLTLEGRPMDQIFEGNEVLVSATPGYASYKLLLNNQVVQAAGLNNLVSFQAELGTYYVRVFATDVNFCVSQDQIEIDVDSKKLPNIFTPNKDGKNDIFLEGFDLQVFSRAGELLYKGTNGWDGTYKGKLLPQGTYLYVVKRTMNNGEQRLFKGTVTLKL